MEDQLSKQRINWLYLFTGLAVLINFSGLFVTIIGPDGALYASIAKTMAVKNNFMELFVEGTDWLDKPHFPFWMAALSFKLFGITTWAYKLPAILFVVLAAVYTYKLAILFYNKETALWASLILLTAQHIIISNTDVRAEPYLTGLVIGSVYHFYRAQQQQWFWHLLFGSLLAACAVMTKGIFALIPVFGAIAGTLLITKNWKMLFNFRWLLAVVLVALLIVPELWSLYVQFDAHPEKVVFGQTNVSGLKFFFWDSQFGRFFNTGPIKKTNGDPSFFLHTSLWAFLPWSFLFYIGLVQFFRNKKKAAEIEWLCICAAALTFVVLSASKFQLPHYLTIIFPFFAILTARYIVQLSSEKEIRNIRIMQGVIIVLMTLIIGVLHYFFRPQLSFAAVAGIVLTFILGMLTRYQANNRFRIFFMSVVVVFFVNIYFNLAYYPELIRYQADSEAAFWINHNNPKQLPLVKACNTYFYAIDFYSNQDVHDYREGEEDRLPPKPYLLFAEKVFIDHLVEKGVKVELVRNFDSFRITRVNGKFLNHKKRKEVLWASQLVLIK